MYNAPAVSYPVGRSVFHALVVGVLTLAVSASGLAWLLSGGRPGLVAWIGLLLGWCAAGLALGAWWRAPAGRLQWDGAEWNWQSHGEIQRGQLSVRMDGQWGMLLEFRPLSGGQQWCWAESRTEPAQWLALRRALHGGEPAPSTRVGVADA